LPRRIGLATLRFRSFRRNDTTANPYSSTNSISSCGPYRFSRNPMYVSLCLIQPGIAAWTGNLWLLATLLPAILLIRFGVIAREERYLENKFGEQYLQYKHRVRRWM